MTTAPSSPPDPLTALVTKAAQRVQREITLARFLGKLAVDQAVREVSARLAPPGAKPASESAAPTAHSAGAGSESSARGRPIRRTDSVDAPAADVETVEDAAAVGEAEVDESALADAEVDELALADYDHLSSAQIVAKLADLEPAERAEIEIYELAHRHRRTILGKLEQLGTR